MVQFGREKGEIFYTWKNEIDYCVQFFKPVVGRWTRTV